VIRIWLEFERDIGGLDYFRGKTEMTRSESSSWIQNSRTGTCSSQLPVVESSTGAVILPCLIEWDMSLEALRAECNYLILYD